MSNYNFLSGSSIDTIPNLLFDIMESETCYIGFAKGNPKNPWGVNALVQIEHPSGSSVITSISTSAASGNYFFDNNSVANIANCNEELRRVYIVRYDVTDITFDIPVVLADDVIGLLYLSYLNNSWASIQGLKENYYMLMPKYNPDNISQEYVYYIANYDFGNHLLTSDKIQVKIKDKIFTNIPYYATNCDLYMNAEPSASNIYTKVYSGLQKTSNILGETVVTGLENPDNIQIGSINEIFNMGDNATANKEILLNASFQLVNTSSSGDIIINELKFNDPSPTSNEIYTEYVSYESNQKFLTFKYLHTTGKYQYIKFLIDSNEVNTLAIWHEALPFESINGVADYNPPGLDISYLKNPSLHYSIFDTKGLSKIVANDITFVKELSNSTEIVDYETAGFTIEPLILSGENINHIGITSVGIPALGSASVSAIQLHDFHSFVQYDSVSIPFDPADTTGNSIMIKYIITNVTSDTITLNTGLNITSDLPPDFLISSDPTNVNAAITLATTTDKEKALSYGFSNIMISKTIPKTGVNSPTDDIYRQLFITYRPKIDGVVCTNNTYNGDGTLSGVNFNLNTWTYENGLILYLSNKLPVYRKWATADEQFKIIL